MYQQCAIDLWFASCKIAPRITGYETYKCGSAIAICSGPFSSDLFSIPDQFCSRMILSKIFKGFIFCMMYALCLRACECMCVRMCVNSDVGGWVMCAYVCMCVCVNVCACFGACVRGFCVNTHPLFYTQKHTRAIYVWYCRSNRLHLVLVSPTY